MADRLRQVIPLLAVFLFFEIWVSASVAGPGPKVTIPVERSYLLTSDEFQGSQVFNACPAGYHFASYYEIADFTALVYNNLLGYSPHLGSGPPAYWGDGDAHDFGGWIKLNRTPNPDSRVNCKDWTSNEALVWDPIGGYVPLVGSHMYLNGLNWEVADNLNGPSCDQLKRVWCASDPVY